MPVSFLFKHISLLACRLKGKERFYLFYQKNTNPFFQEEAADDERILRSTREFLIKAHQISGFLGLLECRRLVPTQQLPFLDSFSLELVCCAQTCIPWHGKPSSCLPAPSRSTACMLSACCQTFPYSLSSWQEGKSRVRRQRKSRAKVCEWWGHHSSLQALKFSLDVSPAWDPVQQQYLKGLLLHYSHFNLWPFKPFCLFQAAVSFTLHAFRLSVWGHNRTKNQGNEQMMCMEKDLSLYLLQLGVVFVSFQDGNKGRRIKDRWLHLVQVIY